MITVDEFQQEVAAWLAENRDGAPHNYGPICPPDLIDAGLAWQHRINEAGYAGVHWPVEHGGMGLTVEHNGIWLLECARAGVPPFLNMVGFVLAGGAIQRFGTPEQEAAHLRATLATDHVWCQLFSEPGAGSDLASLSTRAELDGDRYIVNGQKVWCSGGRYSNWGILMARTRPIDESPEPAVSKHAASKHAVSKHAVSKHAVSKHAVSKHEGISFFLMPMDLPGVEVRPLKQMTGEAEFDEVFFTDVALPAEHLLGPLHGGWGVGMAVLTNERGHIGTSVISIERRLAQMTRLGGDRELGAVERQRLADLVSRGSAFKALAQRQGQVASTAASLMKLGITDMTFDAEMLRGDLGGADSMLLGSGADGMLGAPGGRIAGGTSQVQRNIIGERLLGLPREPR
ncbi:MAG: acyl-CoA dehydrogenase family protein [Ilumatobacteraceae bacterium]